MDSLMAVDLKDRLVRDFEIPMSATVIFEYPNIAELAAYLAKVALGWEEPPQPTEPRRMPAAASTPDLAPAPHLPDTIAAKLARLETLMRET
jgi:hypothetical protein